MRSPCPASQILPSEWMLTTGRASSAPDGCPVVVSSAWTEWGQGEPEARVGWPKPESGDLRLTYMQVSSLVHSGLPRSAQHGTSAPCTHTALLPPYGQQQHGVLVGGRRFSPGLGLGHMAAEGKEWKAAGSASWGRRQVDAVSRGHRARGSGEGHLGSLEQLYKVVHTGCQAHLGAKGICIFRCVHCRS